MIVFSVHKEGVVVLGGGRGWVGMFSEIVVLCSSRVPEITSYVINGSN